MINIKLTRDNYLLWEAQLVPYLCSQQLLGHVDGSTVAPVLVIVTMTIKGKLEHQPNPTYKAWLQQD